MLIKTFSPECDLSKKVEDACEQFQKRIVKQVQEHMSGYFCLPIGVGDIIYVLKDTDNSTVNSEYPFACEKKVVECKVEIIKLTLFSTAHILKLTVLEGFETGSVATESTVYGEYGVAWFTDKQKAEEKCRENNDWVKSLTQRRNIDGHKQQA